MTAVSVERNGRIAAVTLDRGTKANALSLAVMRELTDVARGFEEDPDISAIILRGRSDNFCLGFDLKDPEFAALRDAPLSKRRAAFSVGARMCKAWEDLEPLTICAIEGWCVGGGAALAVSTDLRVMSENAVFYVPEVERGLNMSWGSVPRIANLVGPARAKRLVALGEKLPADKAEIWGLADRVTADGTAYGVALAMAETAAALPPVALRMCKKAVDTYVNALAPAATAMDADQFALSHASADADEAITAFLEGRSAKLEGG